MVTLLQIIATCVVMEELRAFAILFLLSTSLLLLRAAPAGDTKDTQQLAQQNVNDGDEILMPDQGENDTKGGSTTKSEVPNTAELTNKTASNESPSPLAAGEPKASPTVPRVDNQEDTLDDDKKKLTVESAGDAHSKSVSPGFLLYEVQRGIHNLPPGDIDFVLELGPEVFSYSLADKLGYEVEDGDEPHIPVIESNKDKMMEILKAKRDKYVKEGSHEQESPSLKQPTTAPPPEVPKENIKSKVAYMYDVAKGIRDLKLEVICDLLDFDPALGSLPYALNMELGFGEDENEEHFRYLNEKGETVLREILEKERDRKIEQSKNSPESKETKPNLESQHSSKEGEKLLKPPSGSTGPSSESSDEGRPSHNDNPGPGVDESNDRLTPLSDDEITKLDKTAEREELSVVDDEPLSEDEFTKLDKTPEKETQKPSGVDDELLGEDEFTKPDKTTEEGKPSVLNDESVKMLARMINDTDFLDFLFVEDRDLFEQLQDTKNIDKETLTELLDAYTLWLDDKEYNEFDDELSLWNGNGNGKQEESELDDKDPNRKGKIEALPDDHHKDTDFVGM